MESFERWDFVIWQGAWGDAVQAPLAVRDDAQSAKGQAHTIDWQTHTLNAQAPHLPRLDVFSAPASSKSSHDAPHRDCGVFLAGSKNPFHQTASS
jgi:hypothetical protein